MNAILRQISRISRKECEAARGKCGLIRQFCKNIRLSRWLGLKGFFYVPKPKDVLVGDSRQHGRLSICRYILVDFDKCRIWDEYMISCTLQTWVSKSWADHFSWAGAQTVSLFLRDSNSENNQNVERYILYWLRKSDLMKSPLSHQYLSCRSINLWFSFRQMIKR